MPADPTGIGTFLRKLRLQAGIKQVEVCRRSALKNQHVVRLEFGRLDPRFSTVKRYADAIGAQIYIGFPKADESERDGAA